MLRPRPLALAAALLLGAGCGAGGPRSVTIDKLRPEQQWEGKSLRITGGIIERTWPDHVLILDPGKHAERVGLLCYFDEAPGAALKDALRGQEVTVVGKVIGPFDMWAFPTMKMVQCEFVLGAARDTGEEPAPATKGRGQVAAEREIKAGNLKLRFRHGRRSDPPPWFPAYERLLKDRWGVAADVKPEAGPIVGLHPDDREYNEAMTTEIEKRHGPGAVEKLRKQAEDDGKGK